MSSSLRPLGLPSSSTPITYCAKPGLRDVRDSRSRQPICVTKCATRSAATASSHTCCHVIDTRQQRTQQHSDEERYTTVRITIQTADGSTVNAHQACVQLHCSANRPQRGNTEPAHAPSLASASDHLYSVLPRLSTSGGNRGHTSVTPSNTFGTVSSGSVDRITLDRGISGASGVHAEGLDAALALDASDEPVSEPDAAGTVLSLLAVDDHGNRPGATAHPVASWLRCDLPCARSCRGASGAELERVNDDGSNALKGCAAGMGSSRVCRGVSKKPMCLLNDISGVSDTALARPARRRTSKCAGGMLGPARGLTPPPVRVPVPAWFLLIVALLSLPCSPSAAATQ